VTVGDWKWPINLRVNSHLKVLQPIDWLMLRRRLEAFCDVWFLLLKKINTKELLKLIRMCRITVYRSAILLQKWSVGSFEFRKLKSRIFLVWNSRFLHHIIIEGFLSSSGFVEWRTEIVFVCASRGLVRSNFYQVKIVIKSYWQHVVFELRHKFCNLEEKDLVNS